MKKLDKIFLGLIVLEILILIPSLLIKNPCGSPCDTHSLIDPFGWDYSRAELYGGCAAVCVETFYPITYQISDILILTILIYLIVLIKNIIVRRSKWTNKQKWTNQYR